MNTLSHHRPHGALHPSPEKRPPVPRSPNGPRRGLARLLAWGVAALLLLPHPGLADLKWTGCGISKKAYMVEVARAFEAETGIHIEISGGGATKGIRDTASGLSDMGGTCRHLVLAPEERGVKLHPVGWDALAAIVHPDNPVNDISHEQLTQVFLGHITNWKALGGANRPIQLMVRTGKISGVGLMARELLFGDPDEEFSGVHSRYPSTGPLEQQVENSRDAIAITGISSAKKRRVKILTLNGVEATVENIANGTYKLFRPLYLVTRTDPSPDVLRFLEYIKSPRGQAVIAGQGTVTLEQGQHLWGPMREHMKHVIGRKQSVFE